MSSLPSQFSVATTKKKFPTSSYNNIQKSTLCELLQDAIINGNTYYANIFAIEMIISNYHKSLWTTIFNLWIKWIHFKHLSLLKWLLSKYQIYNQLRQIHGVDLKNNQKYRNLIAQVITILSNTTKIQLLISSPTNKLSSKLASNSKSVIITKQYIKHSKISKQTAMELAQVLEFYSKKNYKPLFYWLDQLLHTQDKISSCTQFRLPKRINTHPIWIIWSIINRIADKTNNDQIITTLTNLRTIFVYLLNNNQHDFALYYVYLACIITSKPTIIKSASELDIINDLLNPQVIQVVMNINPMYMNISTIINKIINQEHERGLDEHLQILVEEAGSKKKLQIINVGARGQMDITVNKISTNI